MREAVSIAARSCACSIVFSFHSICICVYFICLRCSWWWSIGSKTLKSSFPINWWHSTSLQLNKSYLYSWDVPLSGIYLHLLYLTWFTFSKAVKNTKKLKRRIAESVVIILLLLLVTLICVCTFIRHQRVSPISASATKTLFWYIPTVLRCIVPIAFDI